MSPRPAGGSTSEFGPDLTEFARETAKLIDDEALSRTDHARPFKEEIFVELMAEHLADSRQFVDPEFAYHAGSHGRARVRIHGAAFADESCHLFLFTAVYSGARYAAEVPRADVKIAAQQALRFLRHALGGKRLPAMSDDAWSLACSLAQGWPKVERLTVIVVSDGVFEGKRVEFNSIDDRTVECDVFDLRSLFRLTAQSLADVEIDLAKMTGSPISCLPRVNGDEEYDCYLSILPGTLLASLYAEYGVRLLEFNVRAFLGGTNKVNVGIRRTLRQEPNRFLAYNNGISATVKSIEWAEEGKAILAVRGLQIVNGGQTVAALHHVQVNEKLGLEHVSVAVKITMVKDANEAAFVGQVSACANTQSIVQIADFSANRAFHIELERISRRVWLPGERGLWFFERTRGQYQVAKSREGSTIAALRRFRERCPPQRKFSKTELAKFINAWDCRPHLVSSGAQYNYKAWLEAVDETEWMPDESWYRSLISKAIIYKTAQRTVRDADFPGYRAQIVAYLVARISVEYGDAADLEAIWKRQALSNDFEALLALWAPVIDKALRATAGRRNVTQWCKQVACWAELQATEMPRPAVVPAEFGRTRARYASS
ncbi:AIPR family protein [Azospirillum aestuarii]|uniref:AIPR family protein n=1 Tax=Azospirillum aestuarii TaxID=2802052 RepID=UPI0040552706